MNFSILIANYNQENYIKDCLDSILSQTYSNYEIIFVDDCSTDKSLEILNEYISKVPRLIILKNDKNRGVGYTKKKCIENASGELFAFVDPDDAITIDGVEKMVQAHIDNPAMSLIHSKHYICDSDLNIIGTSENNGFIPDTESYLSLNQNGYNPITNWVSFKMKYYRMTSGISSFYKRAVDKDLYFRMEEVGCTLYLDEIFYYYRHHSQNISLNKNSTDALKYELIAKIFAFCRRKFRGTSKNLTFKELSYQIRYYIIIRLRDENKNYLNILILKAIYFVISKFEKFSHE